MTAKTKPGPSDRVAVLARDMVIATISIGQFPPDGEMMRQFVRHARDFYSEVDTPTEPKKRTLIVPEDETGHAEAMGDF